MAKQERRERPGHRAEAVAHGQQSGTPAPHEGQKKAPQQGHKGGGRQAHHGGGEEITHHEKEVGAEESRGQGQAQGRIDGHGEQRSARGLIGVEVPAVGRAIRQAGGVPIDAQGVIVDDSARERHACVRIGERTPWNGVRIGHKGHQYEKQGRPAQS